MNISLIKHVNMHILRSKVSVILSKTALKQFIVLHSRNLNVHVHQNNSTEKALVNQYHFNGQNAGQ